MPVTNPRRPWYVDYCNSALAGVSDSALAPVRRVLHADARKVLNLRPRDHVTIIALQSADTALATDTSKYDYV